ncbi:hypothetical protein ARMGADRAFT_1091677 [Armillaria gallica]|uniref:Uncharacterized protein n=1 Tax=Armillaria gallica TaxID=47427 RepID=A0A2H3CY60_ARMGA|nr:hypothetical protein ARMGADRAFT_1091677 [Armillaria gallica]
MDAGSISWHTTSSVGRRTAPTTTHSTHPLTAPFEVQSHCVPAPRSHHSYLSYRDASDEQIMEELARRRRYREGEAPGELPPLSSALVHSRSDLGARALPVPSTAPPPAALRHVGSWVCALPSHVANLSPSCSPPGLSPALSTSSEALTSLSPPTAHHAATPNHPGPWAPAPLPRERTRFLLPSPPLSSLARISSARPDILSQDVTPVSLLPSCSPPDVKESKLDHQEVPSTPPDLACIPRNAVLTSHYVPVLLPPRSPYCMTDVLRDNRSSLNRKISSYSIQFDNATEPEKLSHGVSNLENAFLQRREACSPLALTDPPIQDAVLAPVKKCKDIPSHSAHFNRGRAMATPLEVIPAHSNPVKRLQSAFVKQELCLSCKSSEHLPQSSVKAESFLIHVATKFNFPALRSQRSLQCLHHCTLMIIDSQLGTMEIRSESFQWDPGLGERSVIDSSTSSFNSADPTNHITGETTENSDTDAWGSTKNHEDSHNLTGTFGIVSLNTVPHSFQHLLPETSLPMTGDADLPMAEDASPSTKAYSAMIIPSGGSTPNVDGEAEVLDSQDNINILL